ncbi:hypothetical protein CJ030_MR7G002272 [Morella rubra]|uniref:Uncharacterized protein n=1 Tax=Morella rubra TaxID=262757 RepID=A0A6A1V314_9ROSI|nr:hypothetical protein CJ030_MR7G002272 [Morella rubra]
MAAVFIAAVTDRCYRQHIAVVTVAANRLHIAAVSMRLLYLVPLAAVLKKIAAIGGAESEDAELSDYTLMALNYLERVDQRKDGKKS